MKISELINKLQDILDENGDLIVQVITYEYQPPTHHLGMGAGNGGYGRKFHGTIGRVAISEEYPNQIEIFPAKSLINMKY